MVGVGLEDSKAEYEERDPTGRYIRYNEVLGRGASKTVYKAFDEIDGLEVAWNVTEIEEVIQSPEQLNRLHSEVRLLKSLKHDNIIKLYYSWVDEEKKTINMITELFTSGSLRQYRKKHKNVDIKAIKNWARQILQGLQYLHSHNPPIIDRDVKCDNIFVNGNNGEVKIGDLGLATVLQQPTAHSVLGTPEFMAPELYDEEYNELVDIYSFGMSMLEMVTCEYPYSECKNPAQIFKKVTSGIKPASLEKVKDAEVKQFIEKCICTFSSRWRASELLKEPFLMPENLKLLMKQVHQPAAVSESMIHLKSEALPMDIDSNMKKSSTSTFGKSIDDTSSVVLLQKISGQRVFTLQGNRKDSAILEIRLWISGSEDIKKLSFEFYRDSDTALSVAGEMVEVLDLSVEDKVVVADFIEQLLATLELDGKSEATSSEKETSSTVSFDGLHLWDTVTDAAIPSYPYEHGTSTEFSNFELKNAQETASETVFTSNQVATAVDCSITVGLGSFTDSASQTFEDMSLSSNGSFSMLDKAHDEDIELKLELDAIDEHYNQCFNDLMRNKQEAMENAKKAWLAKRSRMLE